MAAPLRALQEVVRLTQQHRGLSAGMLACNAKLAAHRPETRDALAQALGALDQQLAGASKPHLDQSAERRQRWSALEQAVAQRQLRLQGTGFLATGKLPPENRATLVALRGRTQELYGTMIGNLGKATAGNAQLKGRLGDKADELKGQIAKTLALADQELIQASELKLPSDVYFQAFTDTIDAVYGFNAASAARSTSASTRPCAAGQSGNSTANSSPPRRATRSDLRTWAAMARATPHNIASPAASACTSSCCCWRCSTTC